MRPASRHRPTALLATALLGATALTTIGTAAALSPAPNAPRDDEVARVAEANRLSAAQSRAVLEDPSAQINDDDQVLFVEPALSAAEAAAAPPAPEAPAALPVSQAFLAHSKPDATRTIYLDFDGITMAADAYWVTGWGYPAGAWAGWDPDGDGPAFNAGEREQVLRIWEQVAEDFAPWDVDVTTEEPTAAELIRSGPEDVTFGTRAVITDNAAGRMCGNCGGVAPVNVFDAYLGGPMPTMDPGALVWPDQLAQMPKFVAEAISHEVGHNLGLGHDGVTGAEEYYEGSALWAPIMGSSYTSPVSQWSKGSYPGANNPQDDLAQITSKLPVRTDEAGATVTGAAPLRSHEDDWYLASTGDEDTIRLGTCSGPITVVTDVAEVLPNLDVTTELLDSTGNVLGAAAPGTVPISYQQADGLGATMSASVPAGTYYLRVSASGNGNWGAGGYDAYASLGRYRIATTGCSLVATSAPGAPTGLSLAYTGSGTATASWSAPVDDGGSPVTGYQVQVDGAGFGATTTATSVSLTGLGAGSHTVEVRAVNGIGAGSPASTTSIVPGAPGPVQLLTTSQPSSGTLTLDWLAPDDAGWGPVLDYRVQVDGQPERTVSATSTTYTGLTAGTTLTVTVSARNGSGEGVEAQTNLTVIDPVLPPLAAPATLTASRLGTGTSARLVWTPVATAQGYQVYLPASGQAVDTTATGATVAVGPGAVDVWVRAIRSGEMSSWRTLRIAAVKVPGKVAKPSAKPGRAKKPATVVLSWRAPTSAVTLTGYRVVATKLNARGKAVGSKVFSRPASSTRFEIRLPAANRWRFTVSARNLAGSGPASVASAAVKPR